MQRSQVLEANLANTLIAELAGGKDTTTPHARCSAPYERVEIEIAPPEHRRTRRRAATISRDDLAQRRRAVGPAPVDFDAACTQRFSAPYARIEIEEQQQLAVMHVPHIALTTGSFEASWFVAPDEAQAEDVAESSPTTSSRWMYIVGAMLAVCAIAVVAITG